MKTKFQSLSRSTYVGIALLFALAGLGPVLATGTAHAYPGGAQLANRSIRMSDSRAAQTGVSYQVSFKPGSATWTVKGIIIDFCGGNVADTPIIDDSNCTIPSNFSLTGVTVNTAPTLTGYTNLGGSWTATVLNSGRTLRIVDSTGVSINPANATPYTFVINGVTNPDSTGTFYARAVTYKSDTGDVTSYTPGNAGTTANDAWDYGGFALSTNAVINISAKVQETLTFCVSGSNPDPDCTNLTAPDLTLGHGAANILTASQADQATAFTQTSTNANGGVIIRMKNTAASGGLNSGANSIPPAGASAIDIDGTPGTAAFGLRIANGSGGTGTLNGTAPYNSATDYAMDASTSGENVLTTYGDNLASSSAPVNNVENTLTFSATASNTTPAGLYTAKIILVAVGSF